MRTRLYPKLDLDQQTTGRVDRRRPAFAGFRWRKVVLLIPAAWLAINVWTGFPLLALWIGSQVQGSGSLTMSAVFVVVVAFAAMVFAAALALTWLNARYDELTGRPPPQRRRYPWLESMRGQREQELRRERGVNAIERAVIVSVVGAVLAFEVWFFFFAGSPFPTT